MKNRKIKTSIGEKIFTVFNYAFMCLMMLCMIYPLYYVLVASFSDAMRLSAFNGLLLKPLGFTSNAYVMMAKNPMILKGYMNTFTILFIGLALNMILTIIGAYFLSRRDVYFKNAITIMIVITMYFSGGIIPFYLTVKELGMENTLASLIIPTAINTFNMIIMKSSFMAIPESLEESAIIDGAGHITIMFKIVVPLSQATIAVIALYYAVAHWNSWFNAMIFLTDRKLFPLQLILREILIQNDTSSMTAGVSAGESSYVGETVKYAVIIVSAVPILCVYPFVQKYFVKGVMIGAVKG